MTAQQKITDFDLSSYIHARPYIFAITAAEMLGLDVVMIWEDECLYEDLSPFPYPLIATAYVEIGDKIFDARGLRAADKLEDLDLLKPRKQIVSPQEAIEVAKENNLPLWCGDEKDKLKEKIKTLLSKSPTPILINNQKASAMHTIYFPFPLESKPETRIKTMLLLEITPDTGLMIKSAHDQLIKLKNANKACMKRIECELAFKAPAKWAVMGCDRSVKHEGVANSVIALFDGSRFWLELNDEILNSDILKSGFVDVGKISEPWGLEWFKAQKAKYVAAARMDRWVDSLFLTKRYELWWLSKEHVSTNNGNEVYRNIWLGLRDGSIAELRVNIKPYDHFEIQTRGCPRHFEKWIDKEDKVMSLLERKWCPDGCEVLDIPGNYKTPVGVSPYYSESEDVAGQKMIEDYFNEITANKSKEEVLSLLEEIDREYIEDRLEVKEEDWPRLTQIVCDWKASNTNEG